MTLEISVGYVGNMELMNQCAPAQPEIFFKTWKQISRRKTGAFIRGRFHDILQNFRAFLVLVSNDCTVVG
jgi:hypothetical protein